MLTNYRVHLDDLAFFTNDGDVGGGGGDSGTGTGPGADAGSGDGANANGASGASGTPPTNSSETPGSDGAGEKPGEGDTPGEEGKPGEGDETPKTPAHIEAAAQARLKAELTALAIDFGLEGEFNTRAELMAAIQSVEAEEKEQAEEANVAERFTARTRSIASTVNAELEKFVFDTVDEEGNEVEVKLTPAQRKQVADAAIKELKGLETDIRQDVSRDVLFDVGEAGVSILHAEAREAFKKATDGEDGGGVSIKEWMTQFREHSAPTSDFVRKLKADHEAELATRYAEGVDDGVAGKASGQVSAAGGGNVQTPPPLTVEEASSLPIQELMRRRAQRAAG